ncbi:MAG: hypothetical protein KDD04_12755, partial [Sinomicrobium sp.]|nr:hypothetical protein [Sinomicrobium sp.]
GLVLNPLLETLEKKGVVPGGLLGGPKQQPQPAPVQTETQDGAPAGDAGANNVSPVPQQQQPAQKEITPEDAMFGIIQGIIKDSGQ